MKRGRHSSDELSPRSQKLCGHISPGRVTRNQQAKRQASLSELGATGYSKQTPGQNADDSVYPDYQRYQNGDDDDYDDDIDSWATNSESEGTPRPIMKKAL